MIALIRYKTVLFDADNTLFDFYRAEREALLDALSFMGITPSEEMIGVYSRINDSYWKMLERGETTKEALRLQRFVSFCAHYGFNIDVPRLAVAYTDFLSTKSYLFEGVEEICRALAAHCRLYIITNGIASVQKGRFTPSPIFPYFEKCFISEELGFEKPRAQYFDAVRAAIPNFDPATTFVVGDSLTSDIKGGIAAGLDTCWYNRAGKEIPDLPITYVIGDLAEVVPLILGD